MPAASRHAVKLSGISRWISAVRPLNCSGRVTGSGPSSSVRAPRHRPNCGRAAWRTASDRSRATTRSPRRAPRPAARCRGRRCRYRDAVPDAPRATRQPRNSRCEANSGRMPRRRRSTSLCPIISSIVSDRLSSIGAIWPSRRSPSAFSTIAWWRRSNSGRPMKRSRLCTRRLSAGADSASSVAAAFTDPSRATCTNASMAPSGGNLRIAVLPRPSVASTNADCAIVSNVFALAT